VSFTVEIPHYEYKSAIEFNKELKHKFGALDNGIDEYREIPPSILDNQPELHQKIANHEPLDYSEQKELGNLFEEHISKLNYPLFG